MGTEGSIQKYESSGVSSGTLAYRLRLYEATAVPSYAHTLLPLAAGPQAQGGKHLQTIA